ncbi:MAG: hypothetical protein IJP93_03045 [Bacteroidales bacterium]|nr:hypothetical protein [Bacteroidales bacterium]MBR0030064.1 hypothetical protein [Bacteroidales bacterium]MBR0083040.1 hypothetical protein [Bacteroidales bacterium]
MKKSIVIAALLLAFQFVGWSQAKKPTIMVVPADAFCERYGYVQQANAMGQTVSSPDYARAMKENADIRTLVAAMADFMAKNDFPIQSLEQELKRLQTEDAELAMMTGKNSGAEVDETPLERLRRSAKADIILDLDYEVHRIGPQKQVSFNLQAIDAYSSKIISGNTGVSTAANVPLTSLLEECVLSFKDNFLSGLQHHFDDLFANGREISITLLRYNNCPVDFEEEYEINGEPYELAEIIEAWMADNTVEGRFTTAAKSANRLRFNQVRIPLYAQNMNGRDVAIDAEAFVKPLVRMLKKAPYKLTVGSAPRGLGDVWITIGDK